LVLRKYSVLVIDENTANRDLVADMCRQIGFGLVHTVRAAETGLAHLQEQRYHVVLCDWGLPAIGPGFVRAVRNGRNTAVARTPIVLYKMMPGEIDAAEARASGANRLLARPFSTQTLRETVQQFLT
jgi:two-component system chemotaxis response regulator CheY